MSLIISWVGIDTHGVSSAYIASDSRLTWPVDDGSIDKFDSCRKTFYFRTYPDIIAYCGDVLFPSLLLSTLIETADNGMIWGENDSAMERFKKFKKYLFYEFHKFPKKRITSDFELLYINKDRVKALYPNYYAFVVSWNKQKGFSSKKIKIPTKSGLLHVMGSGKADFCAKYDQFQKQKSKETSRNVYQCFAHLLLDHSNFSYGGAPQLVGLYRKPDTNGFSFGIVHNRKRYYNGLKIGKTIIDENIKWRNKYFENCEGRTKQRMPGAQIQDRDLGN